MCNYDALRFFHHSKGMHTPEDITFKSCSNETDGT